MEVIKAPTEDKNRVYGKLESLGRELHLTIAKISDLTRKYEAETLGGKIYSDGLLTKQEEIAESLEGLKEDREILEAEYQIYFTHLKMLQHPSLEARYQD